MEESPKAYLRGAVGMQRAVCADDGASGGAREI